MSSEKLPPPLAHIKVLDLSRVLAGPWATQMFADLGATIFKIERPGKGDDTRGWGPPFLKDDDGNETKESAYFLTTNRGKKSITVDITTPEGQNIIKELAKRCDIVVENFKVGGLKKYGLDYPSLKQVNPKIIYCSISGFGQDGPSKDVAGYDHMIQAMGGFMSVTGKNGGEPIKAGIPIADITTGMYASSAILAALIARDRTGKGQHIDISLLDSQVAALSNQAMNYLISGKVPERMGNCHPNIVPYQAFQTKDDYIVLAVGNDQQFLQFCQIIGRDDLGQDSNYQTNELRVKNREALIPILEQEFRAKTMHEWQILLEKGNIPCGPVNNVEQVLNLEQIKHRKMKIELPHALNKKVPLIKSPINLSETPLRFETAPPTLGQHSDEVLKDFLLMDDSEIENLRNKKII